MLDFDGALDRWHASKLEEVWAVDEEDESDDAEEPEPIYNEDESER
jgi:hypothetical protein